MPEDPSLDIYAFEQCGAFLWFGFLERGLFFGVCSLPCSMLSRQTSHVTICRTSPTGDFAGTLSFFSRVRPPPSAVISRDDPHFFLHAFGVFVVQLFAAESEPFQNPFFFLLLLNVFASKRMWSCVSLRQMSWGRRFQVL